MKIFDAPLTEVRLFIESLEEDAPPPSALELDTLTLPSGVSALRVDDGVPQLVDALVAPHAIRLEPIEGSGRAVLMHAPAGSDAVRRNGEHAAVLEVLEIGDQLRVRDTLLHVTEYERPRVSAPPPELVGKRCPVCLVRVSADDSNVLVHPPCGSPLHLDPESAPEAKRLDCARLGDCPTCEKPVQLEEAYAFVPELGS